MYIKYYSVGYFTKDLLGILNFNIKTDLGIKYDINIREENELNQI